MFILSLYNLHIYICSIITRIAYCLCSAIKINFMGFMHNNYKYAINTRFYLTEFIGGSLINFMIHNLAANNFISKTNFLT